jgi:hypothetical protein
VKRYLGLLLSFLAGILILSAGCLPEVKDYDPPAVFIVYPYDGSVLSGVVTLRIEAYDPGGELTNISCYLDGLQIASAADVRTLFVVDFSPFADNQRHVITASAQDQEGNKGVSPQVFVVISNTDDIVPPTVDIVNPIDGQVVKDSVSVVANAEDDRLISQVAFFLNGDSIISIPVYPYKFLLDVSGFSDSIRYNLFAKAFDNSGNYTISGRISVTMYPKLIDTAAPTIVLLYPLEGSVLTGTVDVMLDVNDNFVVSRVEFYVDGNLVLVDTSPPWKYTWNTTPWADGGEHTLYFKAMDSSGNIGTNGPVTYTIN